MSNGTAKIHIVELETISNKWKISTDKRFILEFKDIKKVHDIPDKVFLLVIKAIIANLEVSRFLNDRGISCDLMFPYHYDNLGLKKENILLYIIKAFNYSIIHPWGSISSWSPSGRE